MLVSDFENRLIQSQKITPMKIRIGSRKSDLARWQAEFVSRELVRLGHETEFVWLVTSGDVSTTPLSQAAGVGVFTKEIQRAVLDNRCDIAVHSLKDLPTVPVPGLSIAAVPARADVRDCFLSVNHKRLADLPKSATIGTGSPRRIAQLLRIRPDVRPMAIRGNLDTRIRQLDEGRFDAIILAAAGLQRLNLTDRINEFLSINDFLPAVGQGALGIECRSGDEELQAALLSINDWATRVSVEAERTVLRTMEAGCLTPMAAHASLVDRQLILSTKIFAGDGQRCVSAQVAIAIEESIDPPAEIGRRLGTIAAKQLHLGGASRLLRMTIN